MTKGPMEWSVLLIFIEPGDKYKEISYWLLSPNLYEWVLGVVGGAATSK